MMDPVIVDFTGRVTMLSILPSAVNEEEEEEAEEEDMANVSVAFRSHE